MKNIATVIAATLITSSANAAVTIFTSQSAFTSALNISTIESFGTTTLAPGLSFVSTAGHISGGKFNDRVVKGGAQTAFNFATPIKGFGAVFDESPGGFGQGLKFTINGAPIATQLTGATGTFFGFISSAKFSSVLIQGGNAPNAVAETYNLDNLQFGTAVPDAASWALMTVGFAIVGGSLRRRAIVSVVA